MDTIGLPPDEYSHLLPVQTEFAYLFALDGSELDGLILLYRDWR